MQLKTLLVTFSLIGCASGAPKKPSIELCPIDYPSQEAICGNTNGEQFTSTKQLNYQVMVETVFASSNLTRKPLSYLDKGTGLTPGNWEILMNYLHELEDYAKNRCK